MGNLDNIKKSKVDNAKRTYSKKEIGKLKKSEPRKWYHWLKRLVPSDKLKGNEIHVESIHALFSK